MDILKLLNNAIKQSVKLCKKGHVATYIPALGNVSPNQLSITYYDLKSNSIYSAGDTENTFVIESISKVPVLLLAL